MTQLEQRQHDSHIFLQAFIRGYFEELHYKYEINDILPKIEEIPDSAIQDIVRLAYNLCLANGVFGHWDSDDFLG